MGLLLTDLRADFAVTRLLPLTAEVVDDIKDAFAALDTRVAAWFAREHSGADGRRTVRTVDMRYAGQNYELPVPLPEGQLDAGTVDRLAQGFADAHWRMYGFVAAGEPIQLVTFRVEATGLVRKATLARAAMGGADATAAIREHRDVWIAEEEANVRCPVYDRDRLGAGNRFPGPAVVEQMDATTLVLPGMRAHVDAYANLILEAA